MAKPLPIEEFSIPQDSDFHEEHLAVKEFVDEVEKARGIYLYQDIQLKNTPSGERILDAKPDAARRIVVAAVEQTYHWDEMAKRVRSQETYELNRINTYRQDVWEKRRAAAAIVKALTRRKLPFERSDLLLILQWCAAAERLDTYSFPIGNIVRALQRYAESQELDEEFSSALQIFSRQLQSDYDKDVKRHATKIKQLLPTDSHGSKNSQEPPTATKPSPTPSMAGSPSVLRQLKQYIGMLSDTDAAETTAIGPDLFPLSENSPLSAEHQLLSKVFEEVIGTADYYSPNLTLLKHGKQLLNPPPDKAARLFFAAVERRIYALLTPEPDYEDHAAWQSRYTARGIVNFIPIQVNSYSRDEIFDALLYYSTLNDSLEQTDDQTIRPLIQSAERYATEEALTEGERYVLSLVRVSLVAGPLLGVVSKEINQLTTLIEDGASFCLAPGEAWTDLVNSDYSQWSHQDRDKWNPLFEHWLTATSSRPSKKWLRVAGELIETIGDAKLVESLLRWLPEVTQGRSVRKFGSYSGDARGMADTMHDENATALRGILWTIPTLPQRDQFLRLVSEVTLSAYRKVPGVGPRSAKVGNAGVYFLSELGSTDAIGQLAVLKVRVKFATAQKEIEKAFHKTAETLGLPKDEIEEMGVPAYGLTEVGYLAESMGDYQAEIMVKGTDAVLSWRDSKGKALKSVPAKVRADHSEALKDIKQSLKDIRSLLPAQRERIDSMFLSQRSWPIATWKERYLDHPLVGTIARRIIWCIDGEPALFIDGLPTSADGSPIEHGATAEITLWHPIGQEVDDVVAWRNQLEACELTQPFKQAHREVYLLTAAEENTGTYSNRFAAHIIRQHQFNALCSVRGWKNQLRLMVDDCYSPPTKLLPQWNLRAEFWVEGIGDGYGTDTNEAGSYLYLATDQVRFYRLDAATNLAHAGGGGYTMEAASAGQNNMNEPLPLDQIPPLVFSEVMRDVDLFVGVASVGNDPNWQDGGPEGRYQEYWNSYSFGELSESAGTRKEVLQRLVPRLKIAERCSFSDRFLIVKGDVRTYKIHLGSGNILMEPNDEYLCIVPDSRAKSNAGEIHLPFEGDRTLSIILSKALLLAADTKIKDPTILRQIKR